MVRSAHSIAALRVNNVSAFNNALLPRELAKLKADWNKDI